MFKQNAHVMYVSAQFMVSYNTYVRSSIKCQSFSIYFVCEHYVYSTPAN